MRRLIIYVLRYSFGYLHDLFHFLLAYFVYHHGCFSTLAMFLYHVICSVMWSKWLLFRQNKYIDMMIELLCHHCCFACVVPALWKLFSLIVVGSVSDLLDYINQSYDAKGKESVGLKRRNYIARVFLFLFCVIRECSVW